MGDLPSWAVAVISVVVTLVVVLIVIGSLAGSLARVGQGMAVAKRAATDPEFAAKLDALMGRGGPPKPTGAPLRLLAILQRKGRLIDFLMEDIQAYGNEQIGQSVRDIHRDCQKALKEHVTLAPVLPQAEGQPADVPPGFDPSAIQLTGNVTGQPPFRGTVQHPGWKVTEMRVPEPPAGQDEFVLMPAEVQL
jgi:hypothetical protein